MGSGGWSRRRFVGALAGSAAAAAVPAVASCSDTSPPAESPAPGPSTSKPSTSSPGSPSGSPVPSGPRPLYIGTYTSAEGGGKGIGLATYDPATGRVTGAGTLAGIGDPSYLAVHPDGRTLYAVSERDAGAVT